MISIIGTSLKKIRDDAHDADLSPDGSQIIFATANSEEIWVMNADGSQARPLIKAESGFHLYSPTWLANNKRIAYVRYRKENGKVISIMESRNLRGEDPVVLVDDPNAIDATLGQPGRLLYTVSEPPPHDFDSNLWEIYYDLDTGKPKGSPQRLTDWTGFSFLSPGITADGKRFIFLNTKMQTAVYLGELASGGDELKNPQRVTLNENINWPTGWTADAKAVFFYSNRDGDFNIYRQGLSDRTAQTVTSGPTEKWAPQMSPDGKWILYMQWEKSTSKDPLTSGKLMRVASSGGVPEPVMDIQGKPSPGTVGNPNSTFGGYPSFRCPVRPRANCVVGERHGEQIVFSTFDPVQGRKSEVASLPRSRHIFGWDLSPDGTRLALSYFSYTEGQVEIIPLDGSPHQKISAAPWTDLIALSWAADGKSVFLSSFSSRGAAIVHMDLAGHSKMLFKPSWDIVALSVSPDGKYLAFGPIITDANAWTMASFPAK